jgi:hypothetical protein
VNPLVKTRLLRIAVIPMFFAATLSADTLILRDGRRIEGRLISYQNGVIEFQERDSGGFSGRISKEDVLDIEFGRAERQEWEERQERQERQEQPQASQQRPRGLREKRVMVVANTAWTDTGIDLTSGQSAYFEASGEIIWGPNRRAGPDGESNSPNNKARPIANRAGGSLIGRVGMPSDPFFIGTDRGVFRVRGSGRLFLGINDDYLQDNSGYFTVMVYY